jgi:hypothetical protein
MGYKAEVRLRGWMIAGAIAELQLWLDEHDCVPQTFEIIRAGSSVVVRVEFDHYNLAEAFEREFAR